MNIKNNIILKVFCFTILVNSSVLAETKLMLCNGIWTTKACEKPEQSLDGVEYVAPVVKEADAVPLEESEPKKEEEKIAEKVSVTPTKDAKEIASAIHPLNMKVAEIKRKFGKDFDISETQTICRDEKSDISACKKSVSDALATSREYELKLEELQLEEKQLEESMNNQPPPIEQNVVSINQVTTTIEKNTIVKVPPKNVENKIRQKTEILGEN